MAKDEFTKLPSPYYRVTTRAIILDDRMRLLIIENDDGTYELPGGGWEHKESFEACIKREVKEELGVDVLFVGDIWFQYRGKRKGRPWFLRLCTPVLVKSNDFKLGKGMKAVHFVNRQTLINTKLADDEEPFKEHIDKIWTPQVEKKGENR
ncbi:MAG TPA: NUDIX hydrolase [Candidatus Saccharimonadales bacterium]|nr:NUDIX hydrolase [Candidatus Saccharimonadales bacterium]